MTLKRLLVFCLVLFLFACKEESEDPLRSEILAIEDNLLRAMQVKGDSTVRYNVYDRMDHYNVPGISIAVVEDGKLKWAKGYGLANTSDSTEVDENTLFQAGSISKPVAALAVMQQLWGDLN